MYDRAFLSSKFWGSKLGQASLASIVAMTAMIVFSTQIDASSAHAASLAHPDAAADVTIEIA